MVVVVEKNATEADIERIIKTLQDMGFDVHRSTGVNQTVLGAIGVQPDFDTRHVQILPGVVEVYRITEPFKLASRSFKREDSAYKIKDITIGGPEVVVMAGPCAIESEEQIFTIAKHVAQQGARVLRGGAFKPRTSPYAFQGLGEDGLRLMRQAADKNGLLVITEVMDRSQIRLVEKYADILQIGARNMQNFTFLKALGKASKPVMLKRGLSATIEEWLMSAEYILSGGNHQVILCERGIRTFETATRNTMDISAIPVIHKKSHLPIIADPSHGTGLRDKVIPMARAAVAAGADGLIIEVHHDPTHAKSDGPQSLEPDQFTQLMKEIRIIANAIGRSIA
ncbi:MAG: 3-deoxy-7-phosphoheptulonate synthase [Bacteroidota bacterium]